jgi:hypothetical protein
LPEGVRARSTSWSRPWAWTGWTRAPSRGSPAWLDEEVAAFRSRPLSVAGPYVLLDATFPKVRGVGRVVNMALMIAVGVTADGARTILGLELGASEDGSHWRALLRSLRERGLHGVQLVTSDDHPGLRAAVASEWVAVTWQRCAQTGRGRDLPAPGCGAALGWRTAGRAGRAVGNVVVLLQRGVHGCAATHGPRLDRHDPGDLPGRVGGPGKRTEHQSVPATLREARRLLHQIDVRRES